MELFLEDEVALSSDFRLRLLISSIFSLLVGFLMLGGWVFKFDVSWINYLPCND